MFRKMLEKKLSIPQITIASDIDMNQVLSQWPQEANLLKLLAPVQKDLIMRNQRNSLVSGYKQKAWGEVYQSKYILCPEGVIEVSEHLF